MYGGGRLLVLERFQDLPIFLLIPFREEIFDDSDMSIKS